MRPILLLVPLLLSACAADRYTDKPMLRYDPNTQYHVEPADDGFTVFVWHERYQFLGNDARLETTGQKALEGIVRKVAESSGKAVRDLEPEHLKSNTGRDAWGNSSWSAEARVFYK